MVGDDATRRFKRPITVTRTIAAPATEVWDAISMPGNLEPCHPFCEQNRVMQWPDVGSYDELRYLSGLVFERRFTHWLDGVGYDLDIGRPGGATSSVSWRISAIDEESCTLTISVRPHLLRRYPAVIRWLPHLLVVRPRLRSYLRSVVQGFEWYVTRGEPVPRNQFGTHPWFS
jgi:hypothetical protein